MRLFLLFALLFAGFSTLAAQEVTNTESAPTHKKEIPSSARIKLTNGSIDQGWLYKVDDSTVVLLHAKKGQLKKLNDPQTTQYSYRQINSISTRKKNAGLKGALLGFGIGTVTGVIMGFAEGDDKIQAPDPNDPYGFGNLFIGLGNAFAMTAGEKAVAYGAGLGIVGGIVGGITGAIARKKFIIGGHKEKFHDKQSELMRRLVINQ